MVFTSNRAMAVAEVIGTNLVDEQTAFLSCISLDIHNTILPFFDNVVYILGDFTFLFLSSD
jgi:hypothetical protein